jgi:hypothetical protein
MRSIPVSGTLPGLLGSSPVAFVRVLGGIAVVALLVGRASPRPAVV